MTSLEKRQLRWVVQDFRAGKTRAAMRELCRLADWENEVPDLKLARGKALGQLVVDTLERGVGVTQPKAQPKPRRRIVDHPTITQYKHEHPYCETAGPDCSGALDFSHLNPRWHTGDDIPSNGICQCRFHHELWERSKEGWMRAVGHRLAPEARMKVLAIYPELAVLNVISALPERR